MVKIFSNDHVYKHSWSVVTKAFWGKYPNAAAAHVKEIDCYDRSFDGQTGALSSKRILKCVSKAIPSWMERLGFPSTMYVQEESVVNAREQKLVLRSSNISGSSFMVVEETCSYSQHPENSDWTVYRQEAKISAFAPMFSETIEGYSLQNMTNQASKGLDTMEQIISNIQRQGIDCLLPSLTILSGHVQGILTNSSSAY